MTQNEIIKAAFDLLGERFGELLRFGEQTALICYCDDCDQEPTALIFWADGYDHAPLRIPVCGQHLASDHNISLEQPGAA